MSWLALLVRAEFRRRWLALVVLGLLAGMVGAATATAVAGARRSDTAYDRLAERTGQPDASLYSFVGPDFLDEALALPEVDEAWPLRAAVGRLLDVPEVSYLAVISGPPRPDDLFHPLLEAGRLPADDAAGEVALASGLAEEAGVGVGTRFRLGMLTQEEFESFDEGFGDPDGPVVDLEIVGLFSVAGNDTMEQVGILGSPAFVEVAEQSGGGEGAMIRLVDEPGAADRFRAGVREAQADHPLPPDSGELGPYDLKMSQDDRERSHTSSRVVANGLLLAGAVGLLIGLLGLAQALFRHQPRTVGLHPALGALGLDRRQRVIASLVPFAVIAAPLAAVVTFAGAVALSSLLPIGAARRIEPSPGIEVNLAVLVIGAVLAVLVLLALVALVAVRLVRRGRSQRSSGSAVLARPTRLGVPVPVGVGAGLAFDRAAGSRTVPLRAALAGGVVAVGALVGAAAFAASLDQLLETPERYGSPGDLMVTDTQDELIDELLADPDVAAVLETHGFDLEIDGSRQDALTAEVAKGSIGFNFLEGRPPSGPAEIALGPALADRLEVGVGDEVTIGEEASTAVVTGVVLARGDTGNQYADAALVDEDIRLATTTGGTYREALIRFAPGADVDAAAARLAAEWEVERFVPPSRLVDIAQIRNLPIVLAVAVAILGAGLLGHALVVTLRRRGHDLALLRALGARPRDTALTVVVLTVIVVALGVGLGIPVGVLAGNLAWRQVADSLYVASDLTIPLIVVGLCLPVGLVVGLLAATVPTWRASRLEVAELLRRE